LKFKWLSKKKKNEEKIKKKNQPWQGLVIFCDQVGTSSIMRQSITGAPDQPNWQTPVPFCPTWVWV